MSDQPQPTGDYAAVEQRIPETMPTSVGALVRACYWLERLAYNRGPLRSAIAAVESVWVIRHGRVPPKNQQQVWAATRCLALRGGARRQWTVRVEWKAQDCWLGVFWKRDRVAWVGRDVLDVWVCVVPMVPLHITRRIVAPETDA